MITCENFSLETIPSGNARCLLRFDGRPVVEFDGTVLEAQFRCSIGYLVVVTDGNPFEEILHFYLLSEHLQMIDQLALGQIYHAGILKNLTPLSDDQIEFSFFGDERWRLSVAVQAHRMLRRPFSPVRHAGSRLRPRHLDLVKVEPGPTR